MMILQNIFLVPGGHESMLRDIVHNNNDRHSVSRFPYEHIVTSDTSTNIDLH